MVLLLHLSLGCLEFALKLLDATVDVELAPLDLQVQLLISLLIKVLLKSLVGFLLEGIKLFIHYSKLVFKFFSCLNPQRRK